MRSLRGGLLLALAALLTSSPAAADVLELRDGTRLDGTLLGVGPTRVVFDSAQGLRFVDQSDVAVLADGSGRPHDLAAAAADRGDPVAVVQVLSGDIRAQRRGQEVTLSLHGSGAVLREGDTLRTGPYGRVTLLLVDGGLASGRDDAVLGFQQAVPVLQGGTLRLEASGETRARVPEGQVRVVGGKAEIEHIRQRSRLMTIAGRVVLRAQSGYTVEIPRNHVLEVTADTLQTPATLAASNTNAWPLRLEYGARWVAIQPGERVVLMGAPRAEPPPPVAPPPAPEPPPPAGVVAARIQRASASFVLDRPGLARRRVTPDEAVGFELWESDSVETDRGELVLENDAARVRLLPQSRLVLRRAQDGPPLRLLAGEATLTTPTAATMLVPEGELGLQQGEASLRVAGAETELGVIRGAGGARFGHGVRAGMVAPNELLVRATGVRVDLTVPPGARLLPTTLGERVNVDVDLRPGEDAAFERTGELETIELAATRLEFLRVRNLRAQVLDENDGSRVLFFLPDGPRVVLVPGTYTFTMDGRRLVAANLPTGVELEGAEPAPAPAPAPPGPGLPLPSELAEGPPARGVEKTLANGAVVRLIRWGELEVKRQETVGEELYVVVAGPRGDLLLGPDTRTVLSRYRGFSRVATPDGRFVVHEAGAEPFQLRHARDGDLEIELFKGKRSRGSLSVEAGTEFDLAIRKDRDVLAWVFGQAVYPHADQHLSVTRKSGLRYHFAAERSGRR